MINKVKMAENNTCTVSFIYLQNGVYIMDKITGTIRMFGGWESLLEMFDSFYEVFTEETNFKDAINYFTPNIGTYVVNQ